jgi:hypothetical protein
MRSIAVSLVILGLVALATAQTYSHSQALSKLQAVGISVRSSGGCSNRNNPRCTSLDGIHTQCIDGSAGTPAKPIFSLRRFVFLAELSLRVYLTGVITLKRSSGCATTITGAFTSFHAPLTNFIFCNFFLICFRFSPCAQVELRSVMLPEPIAMVCIDFHIATSQIAPLTILRSPTHFRKRLEARC